MNNFKKGDIVVYTGQRFRNVRDVCSIVGAKGVVEAVRGEIVVVNWHKRNYQPAKLCYPDNLALHEPENEINKALDVLKKHGTVEFTPTPSPWEGDIYICIKAYEDDEDGEEYRVNDVRGHVDFYYEKNWRKIKAKEVRE